MCEPVNGCHTGTRRRFPAPSKSDDHDTVGICQTYTWPLKSNLKLKWQWRLQLEGVCECEFCTERYGSIQNHVLLMWLVRRSVAWGALPSCSHMGGSTAVGARASWFHIVFDVVYVLKRTPNGL